MLSLRRFLQEAAELSHLKPQLNNIPFYAIVHEVLDNEVDEFKKYFDGEVFLDREVLTFLEFQESI